MPEADLPDFEIQRLRSLHALKILDTGYERQFDGIVELASQVADVPIALVSLVDSNRQWFKSSVGLEVRETPRCQAFCAHAILNPFEELVVEDATEDDRFIDNPLVLREPRIRFYAGFPICSPDDGMPLGTLCVIDDEPKKLTEQQLLVLRGLAKQTEYAIGAFVNNQRLFDITEELEQFASVVAHDLRMPLSGIRFLVERVLDEDAKSLAAESQKRLSKALNRTDRLQCLLEDLLAYSRAGRSKNDAEEVYLPELLRDLVDEFSLPAGVQLELDENPITAKLDRVHFEQVLRNLIGNAIKHNGRSDGRIKIESELDEEQQALQISVQDNGPGIPEAYQQKVFECFETLRPKDEVEGSGMGLAIVRRIVEARGGTVTLQSEEGVGSKFAFTWPLAERLSGAFSFEDSPLPIGTHVAL